MMGKVIAEVDKLDMFVEENDAGDFYLGRSYGLVHTLNWSNTTKNFMVNVFIFFPLHKNVIYFFHVSYKTDHFVF